MNRETSAERIVILNFATGRVLIRATPDGMIESDADDVCAHFADKEGFNQADCQYMVVNGDDFLDDTSRQV